MLLYNMSANQLLGLRCKGTKIFADMQILRRKRVLIPSVWFGIPSGKSERTYRMERSDQKGMENTQRTTTEH